MVLLTGPRQVGETTLSQQPVASLAGSQYLNGQRVVCGA